MTGIVKTMLVVILLLVLSNLFLLFEVHKMNGTLSSEINQLNKKTTQNQKDINNFKSGAVYNYLGGG